MQQNRYIDSAQEFLELLRLDKKVLLVQQEINGFTIFDISLHKKGPREDKAYLKYPFYLLNIRRGNSIIQTQAGYEFCRRGMRKFYDLEKNYLLSEMASAAHPLTGYEQRACNNIFNPIKQALDGGRKISMHRLYKENGEHLQLSFTNGNWLIASKNSTIFIKEIGKFEEEIQKFNQIRSTWPKLIATEWVKTLLQLTTEQLSELSTFLSTHTLIGEYCGNPKYQHLIRYDNIILRFYAIVHNNSVISCLPVEEAHQICNRFGLQFVRYDSKKGYSAYNGFLQDLLAWHQEIAGATMAAEGEGSVVYVEEAREDGRQSLISIFKLKTLEYLIYRDLRERLKDLAKRTELHENYSEQPLIKRFNEEFKLITKHNQPPQAYSYYLKLSKLAFQDVYNRKIPHDEIRYRFVDYLDHLKKLAIESGIMLEQEETLIKRHTRILLITLPLLLKDSDLQKLGQVTKVQSIECTYMSRNQGQPTQRAMSVLHMVPKLPCNINNEAQLEEHLSGKNINDNSNIVFVFLGIDNVSFELAFERLQQSAYLALNPQIASYAVQYETSKPKIQRASMERWFEKAKQYLQEVKEKFPSRVFEMNQLDLPLIEQIYQKFELIKQPADQNTQSDAFAEANIPSNVNSSSQREIVVIYPLLIPGCGKTTLVNYLTKNYKDYPFYSIIADELTKELMQQKFEGSEESLQKQFQAVFKDIKPAFFQHLYQKFQSILKDESQKAVLFLDRNCVPNTLYSTEVMVKSIQSELQLKLGISLKIHNLGLIFPEQKPNLGMTPFNLDFLLTIINRITERSDHILLGNDLMYKVLVCFKNIALFSNFKAKRSHFKKFNLSKVVSLNPLKDKFELTREEYDSLLKIALQCVENSASCPMLGEGPEYDAFLSLFYKVKDKSELPQVNLEEECKLNQLNLAQSISRIFSQ